VPQIATMLAGLGCSLTAARRHAGGWVLATARAVAGVKRMEAVKKAGGRRVGTFIVVGGKKVTLGRTVRYFLVSSARKPEE
jgi:hypothetical protein